MVRTIANRRGIKRWLQAEVRDRWRARPAGIARISSRESTATPPPQIMSVAELVCPARGSANLTRRLRLATPPFEDVHSCVFRKGNDLQIIQPDRETASRVSSTVQLLPQAMKQHSRSTSRRSACAPVDHFHPHAVASQDDRGAWVGALRSVLRETCLHFRNRLARLGLMSVVDPDVSPVRADALNGVAAQFAENQVAQLWSAHRYLSHLFGDTSTFTPPFADDADAATSASLSRFPASPSQPSRPCSVRPRSAAR